MSCGILTCALSLRTTPLSIHATSSRVVDGDCVSRVAPVGGYRANIHSTAVLHIATRYGAQLVTDCAHIYAQNKTTGVHLFCLCGAVSNDGVFAIT